jgi:hypothetical protein
MRWSPGIEAGIYQLAAKRQRRTRTGLRAYAFRGGGVVAGKLAPAGCFPAAPPVGLTSAHG